MSRRRLRQARLSTFFAFFLTGYMLYVWSTGTVALRNDLGLDGPGGDRFFGYVVIAIGLGSVIGAAGIGVLIDLAGPKRILSITMLGYPLSILPLGFAPNVMFAVAAAFIFGVFRGAIDSAMNAHGVEVERHYQRPIMAAFHAAYPAGGTLAGFLGSWMISHIAGGVWVNYVVLSGALFIVALFARHWLLDRSEILPVPLRESVTRNSAGWNRGEFLLISGLGVLALASMLSEGAVADWGPTYLTREVATDAATAGLAVTFFTGFQFLGRLVSDRLTEWAGPRIITGCAGVLAAAGAGGLIVAQEHWQVMASMAVLGIGTAPIVPLMLSAAGRTDPIKNGRNISVVNGLGYAGTLVGPIGITALVAAFGAGVIPFLPLVLLILVASFGPLLLRRTRRYRDTQIISLPESTAIRR